MKLSLLLFPLFLVIQTNTMEPDSEFQKITLSKTQTRFQQLANLPITLKEEYSTKTKMKIAASATVGGVVAGTSAFVGLQEFGIDASENPKFYLASTLIASCGGAFLGGRWAYNRSPNGLYAQAENKIRETLNEDVVSLLNTCNNTQKLETLINNHYLVTHPERAHVENLEWKRLDLRIALRSLNRAKSHPDCTQPTKKLCAEQSEFVENCLIRIIAQKTYLRSLSTYITQLSEDINNNLIGSQSSQSFTIMKEIGFPLLTRICFDIYNSGQLVMYSSALFNSLRATLLPNSSE